MLNLMKKMATGAAILVLGEDGIELLGKIAKITLVVGGICLLTLSLPVIGQAAAAVVLVASVVVAVAI